MHHPKKSRALWAGLVAAMLAGTAAHAQTSTLSTGKRITQPALGLNTNVGSLPMNMVTTPDGKYAITTDIGFRQKLSVIRTTDDALVSSLTLGNPILGVNPDGLYYGLAVKANGDGTSTLYAARGAAFNLSSDPKNVDSPQPGVGIYSISAAGAITHVGDIIVKHGDFLAGLALSADGRYLYAADNQYYALQSTAAQAATDGGATLTTGGRVVVFDTTSNAEVGRVTLNSPNTGTTFSSFPLAIAVAGTKAYVTSQRDGAVYVVDATNPASPVQSKVIPTGAHPAGVLLSGTTLYVSNAHSDSVSVIDTAQDVVTRTLSLRPDGFVSDPAIKSAVAALPGVSPLGLALSPDGATLYAALGDMNAVGVVNLAAGKVTGYIPTGWYPTAVAVAPFRRLLVANGKGTQARYANPAYQQYDFGNNPGLDPTVGYDPNVGAPAGNPYDLNLEEGTVQLLALPNSVTQAQETAQVLANNRLSGIGANPLPAAALAGIKHVFYIIKENRTYDQVLGDEPNGNGAPSLALFGKSVTPNLHALAERFVLLDNFYDCAEASGDGWPWSTESMATEYVIKDLPYNYSDRGRNYDFEGQNNGYPVGGFPARDVYGNPTVGVGTPFAGGAPAIPDVSTPPNQHLWDLAKAKGLSYRNYGFMYAFGVGSLLPDNVPGPTGLQPAGSIAANVDGTADLSRAGVSDVNFRRFDGNYADSDAPALLGSPYPRPTYGHYNQPSRFAEFNREFQLMLKADPTGGGVPSLTMIRFMNDHTQGVNKGGHLPIAEVADNDYAVGQLVQAVSQSPIWNSTAIFVIEDDSQDGPDHVDTHRSTCYVISPWIKQNSVDHTFYNTDSVLHTMELILGLPAMSQYDAIATPILDFDTTASNPTAYAAQAPSSHISDIARIPNAHSPLYKLAKLTQGMDFTQEDKAPAGLLNQVIWQSVKGVHAPLPALHHSPLIARLTGLKAVPGKAGAKKSAKTADRDGD